MFEKLIELAKPIQEVLRENYHPYIEVIISSDSAKLVEVQQYAPILNSEGDTK